MPNNVDERVLSMKFDNEGFEKKMRTTMETLEEFDEIEFKNITKNLDNLEKKGKGFNLDAITDSLKNIEEELSNTAYKTKALIKNVADDVYTLTKNFVSSIVIDPRKQGLGKYEQKMRSVATIINATGKSADEVENVLSRLMKYTDETSYNFADMTQNIGKFTSQGIDLSVAELAMEGIANEAAKSGQGINEASRAMYNLSQSLAAGYVKLIDWKSIANANMATKEFKEQLIQTGQELGTINKEGKDLKGNLVTFQTFDNTLQDRWLTNDVLIKTLAKYADTTTEFGREAYFAAQKARTFSDAINAVKDSVSTGWSQTFQILFGDLDESTNLWTDLATAIQITVGYVTEFRNDLLKVWKDFGGRSDLLQSFKDIWYNLAQIFLSIKDAFFDVFGIIKGSDLAEITHTISLWIKSLRLSDSAMRGLTKILKVLLKPLKWIWDIIKKVVKALSFIVYYVKAAVDKFLQFVDRFEEIRNAVSNGSLKLNAFEKILYAIFSVVDRLTKTFSKLKERVKDFIKSASKHPGVQKFLDLLSKILDVGWYILKKIGNSLLDLLDRIAESGLLPSTESLGFILEKIVFVGEKALEIIVGLFELIKSFFPDLSKAKSIPEFIAGLLEGFKNIGIFLIQGIGYGLKYAVPYVLGLIYTVITKIKEAFTSSKGFSIASPSKWMIWVGAMLAAGLIYGFVNGSGDLDKIGLTISNIKENILGHVGDFLKKVYDLIFMPVEAISKSVVIFAEAIKKVVDIIGYAIVKLLDTLYITITGILAIMGKLGGKTLSTIGWTTFFLGLFNSLTKIVALILPLNSLTLTLESSIKKLFSSIQSKLKTEGTISLIKSFTVLIGLIGALLIILYELPDRDKLKESEWIVLTFMGIITVLVLGLSFVLNKISKDTGLKQIASFWGYVAGLILIFAAVIVSMSSVMKYVVGLSKEVKDLNVEKTVLILGSLAVLFGGFSLVILALNKIIKDARQVISGFPVLLAISAMIATIGWTVSEIADSISDPKLILSIAASMGILMLAISAVTRVAVKDPWRSIPSLIAVTGAIIGIAFAFSLLKDLDIDTLWTAFGVLSLTMVVFAGLVALLTTLASTGLGTAGLGMVVAMLAVVGAAFVFFAYGVSSALENLSVVIETFILLLREFVSALKEIYNMDMRALAISLEQLGLGIKSLVASSGNNIMSCLLLISIITILGTVAPYATSGIIMFSNAFFTMISAINLLPQIVDNFMESVRILLEASLTIGESIFRTAYNMLLSLLKGLAQAINDASDDIKKAISTIGKWIYDAFYNIGSNIIKGFVLGIVDGIKYVIAIAQMLSSLFVDSTKEQLDIHSPSGVLRWIGTVTANGFILGIADKLEAVENAGGSLADVFISGVAKKLENFGGEGILDKLGLGGLKTDVSKVMKSLGLSGISSLDYTDADKKAMEEAHKKMVDDELEQYKKDNAKLAAAQKKYDDLGGRSKLDAVNKEIAEKNRLIQSLEGGIADARASGSSTYGKIPVTEIEQKKRLLEYEVQDLKKQQKALSEAADAVKEEDKYIEDKRLELEKDYVKYVDRNFEKQSGLSNLWNNILSGINTSEFESRMEKALDSTTELGDLSVDVDSLGQSMDGLAGSTDSLTSSMSKLKEVVKETLKSFDDFSVDKLYEIEDIFKNIATRWDATFEIQSKIEKLRDKGLNEDILKSIAEADSSSALSILEAIEQMSEEEIKTLNTYWDLSEAIGEMYDSKNYGPISSLLNKDISELEKMSPEEIEKLIFAKYPDMEKLVKKYTQLPKLKKEAKKNLKPMEYAKDMVEAYWKAWGDGTKAGEEAETAIENLSKHIWGLTSDVEGSAEDWKQALEDFRKDVKETVKDTMTAFDEFNTGDWIDMEDILTGMASRIAYTTDFYDKLNDLLTSGKIKANAYEYLKNMGPEEGWKYVRAISEANDEQLALFNGLFETALQEEERIANETGAAYAKGIQEGAAEATDPKDVLASLGRSDILQDLGENAGTGYANGILYSTSVVADAAASLGTASHTALAAAIDSHSPSKVFEQEGINAVAGFILGLMEMSGRLDQTASEIGTESTSIIQSIIEEIKNMMEEDIVIQPRIRPVFDEEYIKSIQQQEKALDIQTGATVKIAQSAGSAVGQTTNKSGPAVKVSDSAGSTTNYNQYIYTPKAPSRIDIYRDTKSLLDAT